MSEFRKGKEIEEGKEQKQSSPNPASVMAHLLPPRPQPRPSSRLSLLPRALFPCPVPHASGSARASLPRSPQRPRPALRGPRSSDRPRAFQAHSSVQTHQQTTHTPVARSLTLRPPASDAPSTSRNRRAHHAEIPGEFPSGARTPRSPRRLINAPAASLDPVLASTAAAKP